MGAEIIMFDITEKIKISILNKLDQIEMMVNPLESLPILVDCLIKLLELDW